jgi:FkbM family methyltransferase
MTKNLKGIFCSLSYYLGKFKSGARFMLYDFLRCFFCFIPAFVTASSDLISINKKNVTYQFVRIDAPTDHFTQNIFQNWENETFDVFESVKDNEAIAIDIGAWIGTTAIWLSKNFHFVVAVEPDYKSVDCLIKNLKASDCQNVSLCDHPLSNTAQEVIFGPRGSELNESISSIKSRSDNHNDYTAKSITFKQLLYDYIYDNEALSNRRVSFIKCDIEGGEEDILEDVLHFAYNNKCKVYLSFHLDWWKSKKITDFEYLFKYFKTKAGNSICEYLTRNPFASLLFEPLDAGVLVKHNMTAVIMGYNQCTYIKNMVKQLEKYTSDIIIIDNASTYQPLLDYYANDFKFTLLKQKKNYGYTVYKQDRIQKLVGDLYILTDPDLEFNPHLPDNFIREFIDLSNYFQSRRVGFALNITADDIRTDTTYYGQSIQMWESAFWRDRLMYPLNPGLELYSADIDTTFCLVNRRFNNKPIRVAGNYTCFHIPWHKNFHHQLSEGEYESYLINNTSTNWYKVNE